MKHRAYAILVAAIVVAAVLAFVLPGPNGQLAAMMAITFALITAFSAFVSWPAGGAFIEQKPFLFKALGGIAEALAVGIFAWGFAATMNTPSAGDAVAPYITASIVIVLTGFLLISAPRISRQSREARALREARAQPGRPADHPFEGVREGMMALSTFAKGLPSFLRMAWPWLLAACAPPVLTSVLIAQGQASPNTYYFGSIVGLLGLVVGLPTVCVAWHRWLAGGQMPRWTVALPSRAAFSYGWRVWIFVSIANRMAGSGSDAVARWLQSAHLPLRPVAESFSDTCIFGLICALMGIQAIRLPAVAAGDKLLSLASVVTAGSKMRLAAPIGVLIAFAPFLLVRFVAETVLLGKPQSFGVLGANLALQFALLFLEFVAAATFLSRAYEEVSMRIAAAKAG